MLSHRAPPGVASQVRTGVHLFRVPAGQGVLDSHEYHFTRAIVVFYESIRACFELQLPTALLLAPPHTLTLSLDEPPSNHRVGEMTHQSSQYVDSDDDSSHSPAPKPSTSTKVSPAPLDQLTSPRLPRQRRVRAPHDLLLQPRSAPACSCTLPSTPRSP